MSTAACLRAMTTFKRTVAPLFVCTLVLLGAGACASSEGGDAAKGQGSSVASTSDKPGAITPRPVDGDQKVGTLPGSDAAPGEEYTVKVSPAAAKAGEAAKVTIEILPAKGWHLNMEYPTALTVEAPAGVVLAKAEQGKVDAVEFVEAHGEFDVGYTASEAGDKAFSGQVKFAICQDTGCAPRSEQLAFQVAVK